MAAVHARVHCLAIAALKIEISTRSNPSYKMDSTQVNSKTNKMQRSNHCNHDTTHRPQVVQTPATQGIKYRLFPTNQLQASSGVTRRDSGVETMLTKQSENPMYKVQVNRRQTTDVHVNANRSEEQGFLAKYISPRFQMQLYAKQNCKSLELNHIKCLNEKFWLYNPI